MKPSPSQYARMPSSFSLIHQPVGSWSVSHLCASNTGGALPSALAFFRVAAARCGAAEPTREVSAASPRCLRRCLQVRASIGAPWFFHAGHVHMYTAPWRVNVYVEVEP